MILLTNSKKKNVDIYLKNKIGNLFYYYLITSKLINNI